MLRQCIGSESIFDDAEISIIMDMLSKIEAYLKSEIQVLEALGKSGRGRTSEKKLARDKNLEQMKIAVRVFYFLLISSGRINPAKKQGLILILKELWGAIGDDAIASAILADGLREIEEFYDGQS